MTIVEHRHRVPAAEAEAWLVPRRDVVEEAPGVRAPDDGTTTFAFERGPFHEWQRTVTISAATDGEVEVAETVHHRLAVPVWGPLSVWLCAVSCGVRRAPRAGHRGGRRPR